MRQIHWIALAIICIAGCTTPVQRPEQGRQVNAESDVDRIHCTALGESEQEQNYIEVLGNGVILEMVWIPGGTFLMGSPQGEEGRYQGEEDPQTQLTIDGFWMGKYEVSVRQFGRFIADTAYQTDAEKAGKSYRYNENDGSLGKQTGLSWRNPGFAQADSHPAVQISWNDAMRFSEWLSRKSGKSYLLPTEGQWEYACRAGSTSVYAWGDNAESGSGWLNGADQSLKRKFNPAHWEYFSFDDGYVYTAPVGSFHPNAFGLHDMHGNTVEWCLSLYKPYPYSELDGRNDPSPDRPRVLRGGSWRYKPTFCRSAIRFRKDNPSITFYDTGFRVAVGRKVSRAPMPD